MLMMLVLDPELGPGIMNVYIFLQPAIHKGILDSFFFLRHEIDTSKWHFVN